MGVFAALPLPLGRCCVLEGTSGCSSSSSSLLLLSAGGMPSDIGLSLKKTVVRELVVVFWRGPRAGGFLLVGTTAAAAVRRRLTNASSANLSTTFDLAFPRCAMT